MCTVFVGHANGRTLVRVAGDVDIASAPRLGEALELLDGPLEVDCSRLEFIDASGLGVLVKAAQDHGVLILRNVSPMLRKLVAITGLDGMLHVDGSGP